MSDKCKCATCSATFPSWADLVNHFVKHHQYEPSAPFTLPDPFKEKELADKYHAFKSATEAWIIKSHSVPLSAYAGISTPFKGMWDGWPGAHPKPTIDMNEHWGYDEPSLRPPGILSMTVDDIVRDWTS